GQADEVEGREEDDVEDAGRAGPVAFACDVAERVAVREHLRVLEVDVGVVDGDDGETVDHGKAREVQDRDAGAEGHINQGPLHAPRLQASAAAAASAASSTSARARNGPALKRISMTWWPGPTRTPRNITFAGTMVAGAPSTVALHPGWKASWMTTTPSAGASI